MNFLVTEMLFSVAFKKYMPSGNELTGSCKLSESLFLIDLGIPIDLPAISIILTKTLDFSLIL